MKNLDQMLTVGMSIQNLVDMNKSIKSEEIEVAIQTMIETFELQFDYSFEVDYYTQTLSLDDLACDYKQAEEDHQLFLQENQDYSDNEYITMSQYD